MTTVNPDVKLYSISQPALADGWLMSDWNAGQTPIMKWEDQNLRTTATGDVELVLGAAPAGSARPFNGAEFQSHEVATTGTWSWTAQAPKMVDGAVFGMFTYRADWQNQPWVEFDFEFVGRDTTKVQLNIHMEDASGRHISLDQAKGGPIIVDLGFDASQGMHTYDVTVSGTAATFRVDGRVVGVYSAKDMPGGIWQIGPQKSFVDLWCASGMESWTGKWAYDGTPLVAKVAGADVRPGDLTGMATTVAPAPAPAPAPTPAPAPVVAPAPSGLEGDEGANSLTGGSGNDVVNGRGGADTLTGQAGNDSLFGGEGNDRLRLDGGDDLLDGGNGLDWVEVAGSYNTRVDLAVTVAQNTGHGMDTLRNVENFSGGLGNDVASGTDGANHLLGNGGNDQIWGRGGSDTVSGGAGGDTLSGGDGHDQIFGDDGDDRILLGTGDDVTDGGAGTDWLVVSSSTAAVVNLSLTGAQGTGYGLDTFRNIENVEGNSGFDHLTGNAGANALLGQGGNDTLAGAGGSDSLTGGAGTDRMFGGVDGVTDVFVFKAASESTVGAGRDVIHDFVSGIDDIDLRGIDANAGLAGDQAFAFGGSTATAFGVWTVASGADRVLRADVNGDRVADFETLLVNAQTVTAGDLML